MLVILNQATFFNLSSFEGQESETIPYLTSLGAEKFGSLQILPNSEGPSIGELALTCSVKCCRCDTTCIMAPKILCWDSCRHPASWSNMSFVIEFYGKSDVSLFLIDGFKGRQLD